MPEARRAVRLRIGILALAGQTTSDAGMFDGTLQLERGAMVTWS